MSKRNYQICTNCIMDTSDTTLTFDERGWCDYCRNFHSNIKPNWHPGEQGIREIMPTDREDQARRERTEITIVLSVSAAE